MLSPNPSALAGVAVLIYAFSRLMVAVTPVLRDALLYAYLTACRRDGSPKQQDRSSVASATMDERQSITSRLRMRWRAPWKRKQLR